MPDYQKMYYILFNAMSESCEQMLLAMQQAEALYLTESSAPLLLVPDVDGVEPPPCSKNPNTIGKSL